MKTLIKNTALENKVSEIEKLIGNTPLFRLKNLYRKKGVDIYLKLEWRQIGSSVKARPAFNIIKQAVLSGELNEEKTLLDATSGNTGIAYATIGAALGIPVTLCLPKNASDERKQVLKALGVNIIFTSPLEGTDGAQIKAKKLAEQYPGRYFYADQYRNDNNWKAHYYGTGNEIYRQTNGGITHFVAGLGTSGTFVGTGRKLKELNSKIELVSLQPDLPMHGLEGWKHMETAIVPKFYDPTLADQNLEVDTFSSYDLIKEVAQKEGLLISPSSAANIAGALKVAERIDKGVIVTMLPDNAEKYGEVMDEIFKS